MSAAKNASRMKTGYVGVNLLPDEIKKAENAATQRRLMVLLTILVAVGVGAGIVGSYFLAETARASLATANSEAERIATEQASYGGGQLVAEQIRSTQDAQFIATVAEIEWTSLMRDILKATPSSISVISFEIDGSTVVFDAQPPEPPLENARIANVTITATTSKPVDIDKWVKALKAIDGFAGANPVRYESGQYTVTFAVSGVRLTGRFDPERLGYEEKDPTATPTATPTPEPTSSPDPSATPVPSPTPTEGEG